MTSYWRYVRSDLYKLRHSSFFALHLAIPIIGAALALLFAAFSTSDAPNKLAAFCQFIGMAFPFAISMACHIMVEQEARAGRFQNILSLPNRKAAILSKLTLLLASGFLAMLLASALFSFLFPFASGTGLRPTGFYTLIPLVLWGSHIFLYCFHLMISIRYGKNVGIGLGGLGSLLAALLYTGLGTGIWFVLPHAWGMRFSISALETISGLPPADPTELYSGLVCFALLTCIILIAITLWFARYSGNRAAD